ncbi:MAG: peptidase MA family metallohydrolase [Chloroflexota bacterium]
MIRKAGLVALVIFSSLVLLSPGPVLAESGPTVLDNSVEQKFPDQFIFKLTARSDVDIKEIRLHYTVEQDSFADVTSEVYLEFTPALTQQVSWAWDMRKGGGLPSGAMIDYWWTVTDAQGREVATTPLSISFGDERYAWQNLTDGEVTLFWYEGKESFAGEIIAEGRQALERLAEDTGARLKKPVKIYIYGSARDLQGAMIFPQEWVGGATYTRNSVIIIGISPANLSWGKRAVAHELTHLVVHQVTFNPYSTLPTWLDEGLAMYGEGPLETSFINYLRQAINENKLISVRSLSSPFSALADESYLSYAQSYSLVEFLVQNYGQSKMLGLLETFREGNGYDDALNKVYGFNMDGLDDRWRKYVTEKY